jgi:glycosyltransferase involved in cell wall biosynthesis
MKILIITAAFPPEPVVSSNISHDLARELSFKNQVTVICPKPTRPFGIVYPNPGIHENQLQFKRIQLQSFTSPQFSLFGRFRESYSIGKRTYDFIKENHLDIDVMYVNTWPLFGQYFTIRAAKKFNLPVAIHIQDIYPESLLSKLPIFKTFFYKLLLPVDRYIQQNSAKVITISPNMKSLLVKTRKLEEKKVEVVFNWQDEEIFIDYKKNKKNVLRDPLFTFMYLGSLNTTAAVHILINAFGKANLLNARLVIAGNGPKKEYLISLAQTYQNTKIEFWDAEMHKVPEIQDQADVLLLNLSKGAAQFALPSKLSAYLFSEKPVIASVDEDSDTAKFILNAKCGWVVPPENIEKLTSALRNAAQTSSEKLKDYGYNGYNFASQNLSKKINLHKIVSIIECIQIPKC